MESALSETNPYLGTYLTLTKLILDPRSPSDMCQSGTKNNLTLLSIKKSRKVLGIAIISNRNDVEA